MADITKIKINNTTYNIKDPNAMRTSGGTFSSPISIKSDNPRVYIESQVADLSETKSSNVTTDGVVIREKSEQLGRVMVRSSQVANTNEWTGFFGAARTIAGASNATLNGVYFSIDPEGNRNVSISAATQFRNALGAVSGVWPVSLGGTGGTDSGWKTLSNKSVFVDSEGNTAYINYRKIGQWVEVRGWQLRLKTALTDSSIVLATLDREYAPTGSYAFMYAGTGSFANSSTGMIVSSTGNIVFYKPAAIATWTTSMSINFGGMYFVG